MVSPQLINMSVLLIIPKSSQVNCAFCSPKQLQARQSSYSALHVSLRSSTPREYNSAVRALDTPCESRQNRPFRLHVSFLPCAVDALHTLPETTLWYPLVTKRLTGQLSHFLIIHPFNYQDFAHGISKFTQLYMNGLTFCMQLCKEVKPFFSYTACLLDCWLH